MVCKNPFTKGNRGAARRQHQEMAPPDESDAVSPGPVEITDEINRFARGHLKEAQEVAAHPICLRLAAAHRVIDDHVPFPALGLMDRGERILQAANTVGIELMSLPPG